MPAVGAGAGSHVQQVIRGHHRLRIVFDDHHRVAEIAQAQQRLEQAPVVPLMQADRGLIEDVQHADETGPDLGGEADALAFAAGERGRRPVEREVIQADVDEKAQPLANLL